MQNYADMYNNNIDRPVEKTMVKVLVTGASGFIGSRVLSKLLSVYIPRNVSNNSYKILCLTRNKESLRGRYEKYNGAVEIVEADVQDYSQLVKATNGVNIAFYLIHSMEGSSKEWKKFSQKDRLAAQNFAKAATECSVDRIIYLGGLIHEEGTEGNNEALLSDHMRSRKEVGDILRTSNARVTIFRAAVILGHGGGSFQMLEYLVKRLPLMVCPKWVLTKSQPISVDDVVEYLVNKHIKIIIIPFLTPRLSSYWVDLITPVKASLARPLIDSLKYDVDVISGTPAGTFFAVIGVSLGFDDPVSAQYIGFALHIVTGMAAGNVFGQISLFWSKIAPYNSKEGIVKGLIVGMALWIVLFVPLATFAIQPRLDSFAYSAPNQYIYNIAGHFKGLYAVVIGGSLVFHLIYGALIGFISGRMAEIGAFVKTNKIMQ